MVPGLRHAHPGLPNEDFFRAIDAAGGWPVGYQFVGFCHDEREAGFTNSPTCTGWWTVVASADDYHLWKLSPAALQRIADSVVAAVRLPRVNAQAIFIRDSRGHGAAISREPGT